jgi:hypothetical protein
VPSSPITNPGESAYFCEVIALVFSGFSSSLPDAANPAPKPQPARLRAPNDNVGCFFTKLTTLLSFNFENIFYPTDSPFGTNLVGLGSGDVS